MLIPKLIRKFKLAKKILKKDNARELAHTHLPPKLLIKTFFFLRKRLREQALARVAGREGERIFFLRLYLFRERESINRGRGRGTSRLHAEQGARHKIRSQDPRS